MWFVVIGNLEEKTVQERHGEGGEGQTTRIDMTRKRRGRACGNKYRGEVSSIYATSVPGLVFFWLRVTRF